MVKKEVIIVAGGSGSRMGSAVPKQFIVLGGKPILMHTIELFHRFDADISIIIVLPSSQIDGWKLLCEQYHFGIHHQIAQGGDTRYQSVKNGLKLINPHSLVGIHDGVRPLASLETLSRCYEAANSMGSAIPVVSSVESIRKIDGNSSFAVHRDDYKLVQTPQVFRASILLKAYQGTFENRFTDDASVVESIGESIQLVQGNIENIKITTPFDLMLAELLLSKTQV